MKVFIESHEVEQDGITFTFKDVSCDYEYEAPEENYAGGVCIDEKSIIFDVEKTILNTVPFHAVTRTEEEKKEWSEFKAIVADKLVSYLYEYIEEHKLYILEHDEKEAERQIENWEARHG